MKKTLLIMAAGMGSRYGGGKQVDGMGPNGEIIMEYSIADAKKHGFERVVFIIAPSMVEFFPRMMEERVSDMELAFAVQDYSSLPDWFHVPEGRTKPYGTVHAVLSAKDILGDGPFVVINADDLYGEQAYADIVAPLEACAGKKDTACMLAYPIGATLSGHGEVTRGICQTKDGKLVSVQEKYSVIRDADGIIRSYAGDEAEVLAEDAPASMNIFGFTPDVMQLFQDEFEAFLRQEHEEPLKAEYVLPTMIDKLICEGKLTMEVIPTNSEWYGVTYREDRQIVADLLKDRPLR
ncbi:MAG: nucleotidyltransferase [Clostridia bacterium]|nr:nucleotidyltransferase [Clostridia bacterium]